MVSDAGGATVVGAEAMITTDALQGETEVPPALVARTWKLNDDPALSLVMRMLTVEVGVATQTRPVLSATSIREMAAPLSKTAAQLTVAPPTSVDDAIGAVKETTGAPYGLYGPDCVVFGNEDHSPMGVIFT